MVQTKKMNEAFFVKMQKEITTLGELIRARQDEKQSLLDEFDNECKRFFFGKISQKSLLASVKKTNKELHRLDKSLRDTIKRLKTVSAREIKLVGDQAPISYKATISGITGGAQKKTAKKKVVKRKSVKKKPVKKKTKAKPTKKKKK